MQRQEKLNVLRIYCPATPHAGAKEERSYRSYSFLTLVLEGVSGQRHAPAALYSRERTPAPNG
jgi:hypothetical protein